MTHYENQPEQPALDDDVSADDDKITKHSETHYENQPGPS